MGWFDLKSDQRHVQGTVPSILVAAIEKEN